MELLDHDRCRGELHLVRTEKQALELSCSILRVEAVDPPRLEDCLQIVLRCIAVVRRVEKCMSKFHHLGQRRVILSAHVCETLVAQAERKRGSELDQRPLHSRFLLSIDQSIHRADDQFGEHFGVNTVSVQGLQVRFVDHDEVPNCRVVLAILEKPLAQVLKVCLLDVRIAIEPDQHAPVRCLHVREVAQAWHNTQADLLRFVQECSVVILGIIAISAQRVCTQLPDDFEVASALCPPQWFRSLRHEVVQELFSRNLSLCREWAVAHAADLLLRNGANH
mmetsp:Transcript_30859/g.78126  ORF Transcript_30859/g.78126 Transcript_30859/m.78126 type:complete len:279 (-) Transcript_30859:165-1001(-)